MSISKSGIRCKSCAATNTPGAKFCQNCGQPLPWVCSICENINEPQAKYCNQCGTVHLVEQVTIQEENLVHLQQSTPEDGKQNFPNSRTRMEAERKPVAVLFTDIVDSTAIAERLDPEEWRDIVNGAHQLVSQAVYRNEGMIAQLLGDGVLAFFGAPVTHEDDPLRAVRTGLEIQGAMQNYQQKVIQLAPNLQMRVGVNTGVVVVGNIGSDQHMEYLAIGDAVNLAARLQSIAQPGKVVISDNVFQSISQFISYTELLPIAVKGIAEPIRAYQVEQLKDERSRLLKAAGKVSTLVGREEELTQLQDLTAAVQAGIGRVAIITGEPGVGKSRLVLEWKSAIKENDQAALRWIEGHCLSNGQTIAYHLVNDLLRSLAGITASSNQNETRLALQALIQNLLGTRWHESFVLLGHLLSLPLEEDDLAYIRELDPITLQTQYVATLQRVLEAITVQKPLILLCEDLHWADPSSVEVLTRLFTTTRALPLFFCFTSRPDHDVPGWQLILAIRQILGAGLTEIDLQPLSNEATNQLVSNLLATQELPEDIRKLVLQKSDGNPLFIEEVVRMLIERGALVRQDKTWIVNQDLELLEIPDNLKRLVLSRIDRLGEQPKQVLRIASVIGREFSVKVLEQVYGDDGSEPKHRELITHLSTLEYANLVRLATVRPDLRYLFYHAVIQEATYEAILKSDRRILHNAIAEALEQAFPDRLDELASTLGYHFGRGNVHDKAVRYLSHAAENAELRYANQEAIGLYYSAIATVEKELMKSSQPELWQEKSITLRESMGDLQHLIGQHKEAITTYHLALKDASEKDQVRLGRLHRKIGNSWVSLHGWEEATQAFEVAEKALGLLPDEKAVSWWQEWIQVQNDLMLLYYWENKPEEINLLANRIRPVVEKYGSAVQQAGFYRGLVMANMRRERYRISEEILADMHSYLKIQKEVKNLSELAFANFSQGFVYLWHNDLDPAEHGLQTALSLSRQIGDITVETRSLTYLTVCYRLRGLVETVQQLALQSYALATRAGMPEYQGTAQANLAWVAWRQGNFIEARTRALESMNLWLKLFSGHASISFEWIALFPLIAITTIDGQLDQAIGYCHSLLAPTEMRLPDLLEGSLKNAITYWEENATERVLFYLNQSIELAKKYGYL